MQSWIEETNDEILRTWIKNCPAMKMVSRLNGEIVWANAAFCDWSQYTLNELRRLTWMQISVPDKNLEADIEETKSLDAYRPSYTVKKQYQPKSSKPEWGTLTVMRYPVEGEIEFCLCTWEPLKNGTATAFALAMEQTEKFEKRITDMTAEIRTLTSRTDEENWILGTIKMAKSHPRLAMAFIVIALSVFGLNNVVELLQRTGLIQLPVKVEQSNGTHAAVANQIGDLVDSRSYLAKSASGLEVSWSRDFRGTGPLSIADRRAGRGDGTTWNAARSDSGPDVCLGSLPPGESRTGSASEPVEPVREF